MTKQRKNQKNGRQAMILMIISISVMLFVVVGLLSSRNIQMTEQKPVNYKELVQKPKTAVIDVRTEEEFEAGHMPQTINIPLQVFPDSIENLKRFENIILICRTGNRSGKAKVMMEERGFKNVYNGGGWEDFQKRVTFIDEK